MEHSRIFYFENNGKPEIFCGSADWMPRNLERRVEILFPIEKESLKAKVLHILEQELADTQKAHYMQEDGTYHKLDKRGRKALNSQDEFCKEAKQEAKKKSRDQMEFGYGTGSSRRFIPKTPMTE